jgi:hypothetical protein
VAPTDLAVEILQEPDPIAAAVGCEFEEVELVRDLDRSREVGEEDEAGLQRGDEQRILVAIVARDLGPEFRDAAADLCAREIDLARAARRDYDASSSRYRSASRSMSRL